MDLENAPHASPERSPVFPDPRPGGLRSGEAADPSSQIPGLRSGEAAALGKNLSSQIPAPAYARGKQPLSEQHLEEYIQENLEDVRQRTDWAINYVAEQRRAAPKLNEPGRSSAKGLTEHDAW